MDYALKDINEKIIVIYQEVCSLADDESTILGTVGKEVDETLKTAEARLRGILVLVGPRLVGLEIFAVGE